MFTSLYFIIQNTLFGGVLGLRNLPTHVIPILAKRKLYFVKDTLNICVWKCLNDFEAYINSLPKYYI